MADVKKTCSESPSDCAMAIVKSFKCSINDADVPCNLVPAKLSELAAPATCKLNGKIINCGSFADEAKADLNELLTGSALQPAQVTPLDEGSTTNANPGADIAVNPAAPVVPVSKIECRFNEKLIHCEDLEKARLAFKDPSGKESCKLDGADIACDDMAMKTKAIFDNSFPQEPEGVVNLMGENYQSDKDMNGTESNVHDCKFGNWPVDCGLFMDFMNKYGKLNSAAPAAAVQH
jgi:hypothetical protein